MRRLLAYAVSRQGGRIPTLLPAIRKRGAAKGQRENQEQERVYSLARAMYQKAAREFRKTDAEHEKGYDYAYWQGQKNALRTIMAELAPDQKTRERWESLNESAHGAIADEDSLKSQLRDAMYLIGMIAEEGEVQPRVIQDYKAWVWQYRMMAERGLVESTPNFIGWDV